MINKQITFLIRHIVKKNKDHCDRPRDRVGKGFTHACLSVCLCLWTATFELNDL